MRTLHTFTLLLMLIAPIYVCEPAKASSDCGSHCIKQCGQEMVQETKDMASCCQSQVNTATLTATKEDSTQSQSTVQRAVSVNPQNPSCIFGHRPLSFSSQLGPDKGKNLSKLSLLRI